MTLAWRRGVAFAAIAASLGLATSAAAAETSQDVRFTASDGVSLQTTITGEAPLAPRPTIVEFSPYGRGSGDLRRRARPTTTCSSRSAGPATATAASTRSARAPRPTSREVLRWACEQPWSNGRLGLNGFSASAITIYNSLHRSCPCVETAVLKSGTHELYRDLIYPGGDQQPGPGRRACWR